MATQYITKEGLEKIEEELADIRSRRMPEVIERIARAKELGDLSENAEYQEAKEEQGFLAGKISELENLIRKAEVISETRVSDRVTIGSTITVKCGDKKLNYTITGSNEADPMKGMISNESPLGRAFLGKSVKDKVTVTVPKGDMICEILEIK